MASRSPKISSAFKLVKGFLEGPLGIFGHEEWQVRRPFI